MFLCGPSCGLELPGVGEMSGGIGSVSQFDQQRLVSEVESYQLWLDSKTQEAYDIAKIAKAKGQQYGGPKCEVKAISGFRSYAKQQELWNKGRTTKGPIVTYAKPGYSNHNFGMALDMGIFIDGKYMDAVDSKFVYKIYKAIATEADVQALPIMWGGNFKQLCDSPHFEYMTGLTMAQMRERVSAGQPIIS